MARKMIEATTANGQQLNFDAYRVECYTSVMPGSGEYVEVTMYSGKQYILSNELDQELYEGDTLTTLLDSILWGGDNEVVE